MENYWSWRKIISFLVGEMEGKKNVEGEKETISDEKLSDSIHTVKCEG